MQQNNQGMGLPRGSGAPQQAPATLNTPPSQLSLALGLPPSQSPLALGGAS